jgi:hypothetical protein
MLGLNGKGKENRDKREQLRAVKDDKRRKAALGTSAFAGLVFIPERASVGLWHHQSAGRL